MICAIIFGFAMIALYALLYVVAGAAYQKVQDDYIAAEAEWLREYSESLKSDTLPARKEQKP